MTLQTELDEFRSAWTQRVGPEISSLVASDIDDLRSSGLLDRVARPGDLLPALTLPNASGASIDLRALSAVGPLVITFYRGGWCPYCNLELRGYQQRLDAFARLGARLVAVSPETPDDTLDTAQKNALAFPVLSDVEGRLADALGIRFQLSRDIKSLYQKFGHDLPTRNGDGGWSLPMPATFIVAKGGVITTVFADPDYRRRLDPEQALAAVAALSSANAA
ncbi:peroxiredoxin-like family protein [Bosea sp. R86505]|uniref:peroxiredoxin-like family protein n=1 Tax=Bosea sp. R86505 TaxID=3101710 RepID=UPI003670E6B5